MRKLIYLIFIIAVLVSASVECWADPRTHLENGLRAYKEEADFSKAISELQEAIRLGLKDRSDLIQAHLHLGFAYIGMAERQAAEIEFAKAIRLDSALELDPERHSAKIITVFNGMRERLLDALTVISVPGGAEVYLDSVKVGVTPLTLNSVLIGQRTVRIVRKYYKPRALNVQVAKGKDNRVQAQLDKAEVELRITSQPPEAVVYITGQPQPHPSTPVSLKAVLDQELSIKLAKEEFHSKQLKIKLTAAGVIVSDTEGIIPLKNGIGSVHVVLEAAPPPGSLQIISDPPGATVRLDGIDKGKTPLNIARVTPGNRRLRISLAGFASVTKKVEVVSDQKTEVRVELGGRLHILSIPDGAQVYINEKYAGLTPLRTERISSGSHQLRLAAEKHKDRRSAVIVEKGQEKEVSFRLLKAKGSIAVSSDPPGVAVYLDGKNKGNTPLFIYGVVVGRHSLKLTGPGYEDWENQITVEESKVLWRFRKLKTN